MSDVLDLGLGFSSVSRPGREDVARHCHDVWSRLFSRQSFAIEDRVNRGMGEGVDTAALMDACCVGIARDIIRALTDDEFAKLMSRVQRRREAA